MKIDYDYINEILNVFLNSESPNINLNSFDTLLNEDNYKFAFHTQIMADKRLISNEQGDSDLKSLGFIPLAVGFNISITSWRLKADGHDFASALNKADVLSTIKEKFKDEGLSVVVDIAKQLANNQAKKLLGLPE